MHSQLLCLRCAGKADDVPLPKSGKHDGFDAMKKLQSPVLLSASRQNAADPIPGATTTEYEVPRFVLRLLPFRK